MPRIKFIEKLEQLALRTGNIDTLEEELLKMFDAREESNAIRNLLAIVHRDGGHHTREVGIPNSCKDAIKIVCDLRRKSSNTRNVLKTIANDGCGYATVSRNEEGPKIWLWCRNLKPNDKDSWCWSCRAQAALETIEEDGAE